MALTEMNILPCHFLKINTSGRAIGVGESPTSSWVMNANSQSKGAPVWSKSAYSLTIVAPVPNIGALVFCRSAYHAGDEGLQFGDES
jgi:hypothetical protein